MTANSWSYRWEIILKQNVPDYVRLNTEFLNNLITKKDCSPLLDLVTKANKNLANLFNSQNVAQLGAGQLPLLLLRLFALRLLSVYPDQPGSLPTNNRARWSWTADLKQSNIKWLSHEMDLTFDDMNG